MGKERGYQRSDRRDGSRPSILKPATGELEEREKRAAERDKKRKLDEAESAKRDWVKSVKTKGVTCERWVRKADFTGNPFIEVIKAQGLHFFFRPIAGFRDGVVQKFFSNMVVNRESKHITSTIGSKTIVVNPVAIATYLGEYQRPPSEVVTYPSQAWSHPLDEIRDALTDKPNSYKNDKFVSGKLRPAFRLINKLVHFNLNPHGSEATPSLKDGTLLFVFSRSEEKVDWAAQIWDVMANFKDKGPSNANIPFPAMITTMCEKAGVKEEKGDILGHHGCFKSIAKVTERKSSKMSHPSFKVGPSRPKAKKGAERKEQWNEIIVSNCEAIRAAQVRIEAYLRRMKRKQGKIMRYQKYCAAKLAVITNEPYVPTTEDEQPTTSDEDEEAAESTEPLRDDTRKEKGVRTIIFFTYKFITPSRNSSTKAMPRQGNPPITHHDIATNEPLVIDLTPGFNAAHLITLNYTFNELYMVLQLAPEWNGGRWHTMKTETRKSKEQADADVRSMVQWGKDDNLPDIPANPSMQIMVWDCCGRTENEIVRTVRAFVSVHNPDIVVLVGAPNIEKHRKKFGVLGHMRFTDVKSMGGGTHGDVLVAYKSYMFDMEPNWSSILSEFPHFRVLLTLV
ncbi:hypothetical protein RHSIM_Rhsim05G0131600 [Rhododendron simsii]|uniref:Putative plant transposon protein domain-containing protein n=1 Tax=Rhododendron simsii TaxID=118357 RepID=A0A834H0S6_RHOSS|nr:hypothetical protein RHSIM_Rhsim05G0131600 [Rhododendron simsii]